MKIDLRLRIALFFILAFLSAMPSYAQNNPLDRPVTLQATGITLSEALHRIGDAANCSFSYANSGLDLDRVVDVQFTGVTVAEALHQLLGDGITAARSRGNQVLIQASRGKGALSGQVQTPDGAPAAYATVSIPGFASVQTDGDGRFTLTDIEAGNHVLRTSAVGYQTQTEQVVVDARQTTERLITLRQQEQLSEVVVTASRVQESIDEVPSSVTVLSVAAIEQQVNINNSISEILGYTVPGLGPSTNKATNSGQTLRGRSVLVLIDGVPQSTPLMNGNRDIRSLDPAIIERVEVIKGATSIYGNGSGGGIINYITKVPNADRKITGRTTVGTNAHPFHAANSVGYRFSQSFDGTLDKFSYAVSGTHNYLGVFKDGEGNILAQEDGLSQSASTNLFAKGIYRFTPNASLSVAYSFFRSLQKSDYINVAGEYGVRPAVGIKGEDPGAPSGTPQNHNAFLTYRQEALPFGSSLELTGYFNRFLSTNRYVEQANGWYGPGQTQISSKKRGIRLNLHTPWQANVVNGSVTYGVDLLGDVTSQPLLDGRIYIPNMDMTNIAPYLQVKADFFEHLIFKGGLRYENASVKIADFQTLAKGPNGEGSIAVTGGTIDYRATMFNAGLRYTQFPAFNPFVSFSQAFGLNELGRIVRAADQNTLQQLQTDPIITNNYEVGVSSRFSVFHLTGAYYISTSELGANLVANEHGTLLPVRAPERVYGYELTADAHLNRQWSLGATYAYVEGKSENEDGSETYLGYARIAPPRATAYVRYAPIDRLDMQVFWIYNGSRDRFDPKPDGTYAAGQGPVSAVSLFNFSSSYRINRALLVSFGVENLFNKDYFPFYSQYSASGVRYAMGNGAKANLNITYSF